jgi:hypothetical protein
MCGKLCHDLRTTSHPANNLNLALLHISLSRFMAQSNDELTTLPSAHGRARPQLSCQFCRAGKLKCDRKAPCDSCIKREREDLCTYLSHPIKKSKGTSNTKQRIAQLESLVLKLMKQRSQAETLDVASDISHTKADSTNPDIAAVKYAPQSSVDREQTDNAAPIGQLKISRGETTTYVGETHWEAILAGVRAIPFIRYNDAYLSRLRI